MATFSLQPFVPEMSDEPSVRSNERNCPKLCAPRIQKNKIAQEETTMQHHNIPETSSCNISPCVSNLKVKMRFKIKPQAILPSLQLLKSKTWLWRTYISLSTSDVLYCPLYLCMLAVQWCSRWRSNFWMAQLALVDGPRRSVSAGVYCNAFLFPQRNS